MGEIERKAEQTRRKVNADDKKAATEGAREAGKAAGKETLKQQRETNAEQLAEQDKHFRNLSRVEQDAAIRRRRIEKGLRNKHLRESLDGRVAGVKKAERAEAKARREGHKVVRDAAERNERYINGIILRSQMTRNKRIMKDEEDHQNRLARLATDMRKEREQAVERLVKSRADREVQYEREAANDVRDIHKQKMNDSKAALRDWENAAKEAEREIAQAQKDAAKEVSRHRKETYNQAFDELNKQGGRFGQEFRKTINKALADLPDRETIELDADASPAEREIAGLIKRMERLRDQRIGIDINARQAKAEMRDIERQLDRIDRRSVESDVRTNARSATALLRAHREEMDRGARSSGILRDRHAGNRDQALDTANAFRLFNAMILAVAVGIPLLVPAIAGLTAALGGLIPMLLGAGAGLGVMLMGFSGVGGAVKALGAQQADAAKSSLAASKTMRNAAKQIGSAQQGLDRARRDAARGAEDAARRVADAQDAVGEAHANAADRVEDALEREARARQSLLDARERAADRIQSALRRQADAERTLTRAQEGARDAEEGLAEARRRAAQEAAERALAMRGGKLDERSAVIDVREARREMLASRDNRDLSPEDRQRSVIAYEQAKLRLEQIRRQNKGLAKDEKEFQKTGVEGSDGVVEAKERLRDAIEGVKDAERGVTEAAEAAARAQRDAARDVLEAQRDIKEAVEDVAQARIDGARMIADAERAVGDALEAQRRQQVDSAESIMDAQSRLNDAQLSYQEALQQTGEVGSASMNKLREAMDKLSPAGQRFAKFLFGLRGYWEDLRFAAQEGMLPGVQEFMEEMISHYGPSFLKFVSEMAVVLGDLFRQMSDVFRGPIMTTFFDTMEEYSGVFTEQVFTIILNLMELVAALGTAFAPFGASMGDALVDITAGWASWADGLKDSDKFQDFLEYARVAGGHLLDMLIALGDALITIGIGLAPYSDMLVTALTGIFEWIADLDPETVGRWAVALLTMVIALQTASGLLSGMSTAKMFFSKDGGGGFAHPLGLLSLALVALTGLGAILAVEYEWFRDALGWVADKAEILIGWLFDMRAELALVAFAVSAGVALWKAYELGVLAWAGMVKIAGAAQTLFTKKVAIFGITSKVAMGWVFLIVAALVALAAGLVWLYKNNEGFKNFVDSTWGYMKDIASAVAAWFMDTAMPLLIAAWEWLADVALAAWNDYIFPALQGMWDLAQQAFGWIVDNGVPILVAAWQWLADFYTMIWNDFLKPVFMFLWDVAKTVFGWLVDVGIPAVMTVLGGLGKFFLWVFESFWAPVLTRLWSLAKWVFGFLVEHIFPGIGKAFKWLGETIMRIWKSIIKPTIDLLADIFLNLWHHVLTPVFEGIGWVIQRAWDNVIGPVFKWIMSGSDDVAGGFETLLEKVDKAFTWLGDGIEWVWLNVIEPTFGAIAAWIDVLVDIFAAGVEGMGNAWQWLKGFLTDPLRAVIEFVNDYLIGGINKVLGWVGLDGIDEITVPSALQPGNVKIPGGGGKTKDKQSIAKASGGILPGYSPGKDNFHFRGDAFDLSLAGGEAIMRPEWTRAMGPDFINEMNAAAINGGVGGVRRAMGFASGGVLPSPKPRTGGNVWDHLAGMGSGLIKFMDGPVEFLKDLFLKPISKLGDNPFVEFLTKGAGKIAEGAKDKIMGMIGGGSDNEFGGGTAIPGGMPWQQIWGIIAALIPGAIMTSNKRAGGSKTASGWPSYHGLGRAVDFVAPNMGMAWSLLASLGIPWTELYFTPKGFIRKGRKVSTRIVSPLTQKNHYDHVHAAYDLGGIIPTVSQIMGMDEGGFSSGIPSVSEMLGARSDAGFEGAPSLGVYDSGGILQPGDLAINLGNTPERITTQDQWAAIEAAALGGGGGDARMDPDEFGDAVADALRGSTWRAKFDRNSLVLEIADIQHNEMRRMAPRK